MSDESVENIEGSFGFPLEPHITAWPTPEEFERYVCNLIKNWGRDVKDLQVKHLEEIEGMDGSYKFDVTARFRWIGDIEFLCVFECKRHKRPVERGHVQELLVKMNSVGAHKGVMVSVSGFQSGAIEFARKHGIAAVQIQDQRWRSIVASRDRLAISHLPFVRGRYATWVSTNDDSNHDLYVAELHSDLLWQVLELPRPTHAGAHEKSCNGCGDLAFVALQAAPVHLAMRRTLPRREMPDGQ